MRKKSKNRVSKSNSEIIVAIKKMAITSKPLILWQNQEKKRLIQSAIIKNIDFGEKTLEFATFTKATNLKFAKESTIYFYAEADSLVGSTTVIQSTTKSLTTNLPSNMLFSEYRDSKRIVCKSQKIEVSFAKLKTIFKFKIYDISIDGLSFMIPKKMQNKFYIYDPVIITNIYRRPLSGGLKGTIVHITNYDSDNFQIGIKFIKKSQNSIFELLEEILLVCKN